MKFEKIKKEYETKKISYRKLAEKYNIHYKAIERESKKKGWIKYQPTTTPTKQPLKIKVSGGSEEQNRIFTIFLKHYRNSLLNFSESAQKVGKHRSTIYNWLDKFDTYKKEFEDVKEALFDEIEALILKKALSGDRVMLIFFLKTKMKDRGYTESHTLRPEDVPPLKIEFS